MAGAHKSFDANKDLLQVKREESARQTFKQVLQDLIQLLKKATDTETAMLYWVNKDRALFVLETYATNHQHTMFQDRVGFQNLYLNEYKDITQPVQLEVGKDITGDDLSHYYKEIPVRFITILPFVNNGETVALTVLESRYSHWDEDEKDTIASYLSALTNLLQTYLQLTGLSDEQEQWLDYEESLEQLLEESGTNGLLLKACSEIQSYLDHGGVSLLCRGMGEWNVVANSKFSQMPLPLGLQVAEHSIAWNALQSGKPEFSIHFNANPKRVSAREGACSGASMAIPVLLKGRRQAVFVISDENPLVFNEANRHKLINIVRLVRLKLENNEKNLKITDDLLATSESAYDISLLQDVVTQEIKRLKITEKNPAWIGFITISKLQELRTRYRLEDLKRLQKHIITAINPQKLGSYGYLAFYTDFIYAFVLENQDGNPVESWAREIEALFEQPFSFNDEEIQLDFHIGCVQLTEQMPDGYQALQMAKNALSHAVKNPQEIIVIAS